MKAQASSAYIDFWVWLWSFFGSFLAPKYSGTMVIGDFKGESFQEAKAKVREQMIAKGLAFPYAEPEGLVVSRSGDECVVALVDQWYLDYGEPSWKEQAEEYVFLIPCHHSSN